MILSELVQYRHDHILSLSLIQSKNTCIHVTCEALGHDLMGYVEVLPTRLGDLCRNSC